MKTDQAPEWNELLNERAIRNAEEVVGCVCNDIEVGLCYFHLSVSEKYIEAFKVGADFGYQTAKSEALVYTKEELEMAKAKAEALRIKLFGEQVVAERIHQLEAQLADMNKNCISISLHDSRVAALERQLAEARDENENLKKYWQPEEIEASKARATEMRLKLFGEQVVAERIAELETQLAECTRRIELNRENSIANARMHEINCERYSHRITELQTQHAELKEAAMGLRGVLKTASVIADHRWQYTYKEDIRMPLIEMGNSMLAAVVAFDAKVGGGK